MAVTLTTQPGNEVVDLVEKSQEGGFSQVELRAIEEALSGLSGDELNEKIQEIKELNITEPTSSKLHELLNEIVDPTFGYEGLKKGNTSKFFGLFLGSVGDSNDEKKSKERLYEGLKFGIAALCKKKLGDNLPVLGNTVSEEIQMVVWKQAIGKINVMSGIKYVASSEASKYMNMIEDGISIFNDSGTESSEEDKVAGFDMGKLGDMFTGFKKLSEGDKEAENKMPDLMKQLEGFLDYATKEAFTNLNLLIDIAESQGGTDTPQFKSIMNNPKVLSAVLETGEYKEDGYNVDLEVEVVQGVESADTLEADKDAFMREVVTEMNGLGDKMDGLKAQSEKIAGFLDKVGFDRAGIESFIEDLKKIPLIGGLLAVLAGFFVGKDTLQALDDLAIEKKYKTVLTKLDTLINKKTDLPFKKPKEEISDEQAKKDKANTVSFLKKVEAHEQEIYGEKFESSKSMIHSKNFWNDVLAKKDGVSQVTKNLNFALSGIDMKSGEITQSEYLEGLSKLEIKEAPKEVQAVEAQIGGGPGATLDDVVGRDSPSIRTALTGSTVASVVGGIQVESVVPDAKEPRLNTFGHDTEVVAEAPKSLEEQVNAITELPAAILIEGKTYDLDIKDNKIVLGDKTYSVTTEKGTGIFKTNFDLSVAFDKELKVHGKVVPRETIPSILSNLIKVGKDRVTTDDNTVLDIQKV